MFWCLRRKCGNISKQGNPCDPGRQRTWCWQHRLCTAIAWCLLRKCETSSNQDRLCLHGQLRICFWQDRMCTTSSEEFQDAAPTRWLPGSYDQLLDGRPPPLRSLLRGLEELNARPTRQDAVAREPYPHCGQKLIDFLLALRCTLGPDAHEGLLWCEVPCWNHHDLDNTRLHPKQSFHERAQLLRSEVGRVLRPEKELNQRHANGTQRNARRD
mmetsp:Transcript_46742/g.99868  ORF Transcript_46742/g.99868 Transcript_46742/m.99868 type:complete len:213 (+) Transcript_46742:231-869(+)